MSRELAFKRDDVLRTSSFHAYLSLYSNNPKRVMPNCGFVDEFQLHLNGVLPVSSVVLDNITNLTLSFSGHSAGPWRGCGPSLSEL